MTQEQQKQQGAVARREWKNTLEAAMPRISDLLPKHITPERFRTVAANAIHNNKDIMTMMERGAAARVINELVKCAADGLIPDGREAALVTFNGKAGKELVYMPMIRGILKRMRQSGEVRSVVSRIRYGEDQFEIQYGDEEKIVHIPVLTGDRGEAIGSYAIIEMKDGERYREYMTSEEIMKVKGVSKAQNGPWQGPFEHEMWRKTVIKRAAKYCPLSAEIMDMLDRDNSLYDMDKVEPGRSLFERWQSRHSDTAEEDASQEDAGVIDGDFTEVEAGQPSEEEATQEQADTGAADGDTPPPAKRPLAEYAHALAEAKTVPVALSAFEAYRSTDDFAGMAQEDKEAQAQLAHDRVLSLIGYKPPANAKEASKLIWTCSEPEALPVLEAAILSSEWGASASEEERQTIADDAVERASEM